MQGFEDRWRDPRRDWRTPETVLSPSQFSRPRLQRIAQGAPEVFVRATGRPKTRRALADHLRYIARGGDLELLGEDGRTLRGRDELEAVANAWSFVAGRDAQGRETSPKALSIVFGLPAGTDPEVVRQAAEAFVQRQFPAHAYWLALHTDRPHPHAHVVVRWLGALGTRLPSHLNAALEWREGFAREVRRLGLAVEASPRWARGVVRRSEAYAVRKLRERAQEGRGPGPKADRHLVQMALEAVGSSAARPTEREIAAAKRQWRVRRDYMQLAAVLSRSDRADDQRLAGDLRRWVASMPEPLTPRLALIRQMQTMERQPPRARDRNLAR
ncbi:MAG TPA: relaxase/mobilization nuclease domain-containing protein [Phenylobacterium sp.]|nr:relaxase/mobilization nuclease domain-containing protein [Phenylobacterium sp.]